MTKLKARENGQISIPWNATSRIQRNPTVAPPASRIPFLRSRNKQLPPPPAHSPAPAPEPVKAPALLEPIAPPVRVRVRTAIPRGKGTVAAAKPKPGQDREAAGPTRAPSPAPAPAPGLVPIPEEMERQTVSAVNPLSEVEVDRTITTTTMTLRIRRQYGEFGANLLKISAEVEETASSLKDYCKGIMDSTLTNLEELKKKKKENAELKSAERKTRVASFEPEPEPEPPEPETQEPLPFHSNGYVPVPVPLDRHHPIPSQLQNEEHRRKNKAKRKRRRQGPDNEVLRLLMTNYKAKGGSGGGYEFLHWSSIGYSQDLVTSVKAPHFTRSVRREALNKMAPIPTLPAQTKIPNVKPKRNVRGVEGPEKSKSKSKPKSKSSTKRGGRGKPKPRKTLIVNPKRNWTKPSKKNVAQARKSKCPPKNTPKTKSTKRKRSQIEAQEDVDVEDEGISNSAIEMVSMFESDNENDETFVGAHIDTPAPAPGPGPRPGPRPAWSRSMNHEVPHNLNFTQLSSRSSPLTQLQQGSCSSSSCLLPANKKRLLDFDDVHFDAPAQGIITQVGAVPAPAPVKSTPLQITSESPPIPAVVQGQGQGQGQGHGQVQHGPGRRQRELLKGDPPSKPITPIQTRSKKMERTSSYFIISSFSPNPGHGHGQVPFPEPETGSVESDVEIKIIPVAPVSGLTVTDLEIQDQEFIEKGIRIEESKGFNMTPNSYTPHEEISTKPGTGTGNGIEVVAKTLKTSVTNPTQNSQSDNDCDLKPSLRSKRKPKPVSVSDPIPIPDRKSEDGMYETKDEVIAGSGSGSGSVTVDAPLESEENVEEMYFLNITSELTVLEDTKKDGSLNITPVPDPSLAPVPVPVPVPVLWANQPSPPSPSPEMKEARQTRQRAKAGKDKDKDKDTELTSYDMTMYALEDFDEDGDVTLSHRKRKPIPKWARKGKNLTLSLFHQQSELLELVKCGSGLDSDSYSHCWASAFPPTNLKFVIVPKVQRILDLSGLSSSSADDSDSDSDSDENEGETC